MGTSLKVRSLLPFSTVFDVFLCRMEFPIRSATFACARLVHFSCVRVLEPLSAVALNNLLCLYRGSSSCLGFVIPGSTNTWDNVVVAAPSDQMLPAEVLRSVFAVPWETSFFLSCSGRMVIDTRFFDGDRLLASKRLTVYYE